MHVEVVWVLANLVNMERYGMGICGYLVNLGESS